MYLPPELVTVIQRERERELAKAHQSRALACLASCCSSSVLDRVARALRLGPASC